MPLLWKKGYVFPNYTSSSCPVESGPRRSVRDCIIRTLMTKIWFLSFSCCEYFKTGRSCAADSRHYRFSVCQNRCSKPSNAYTSKALGCDGGDLWSDAVSQRYSSIVGAPVPFLCHCTPLPEETSPWSVGTHSRWRQFCIQQSPKSAGCAPGGSWLLSLLQRAETCSLCCTGRCAWWG